MALQIEKLMDPVEPHQIRLSTQLWSIFWACTIVGIPIFLYLWVNLGKAVNKRNLILLEEIDARTKLVFKQYIGAEPKYINTETARDTGNNQGLLAGSGIAYLAGTIYFMQAGMATQFPVSMLRDFHYNLEGHNTVLLIRGDLGDQMTVNQINQNAAYSAFKMSGLFLKAADIEHPVWHLMTTDKSVVTRWMEILQQVREGSIE